MDNPGDNPVTDHGELKFMDDTELDYETKRTYTVTITATDPGLDSDTVTVTVNITPFNEEPDWEMNPAAPSHEENDEGVIATYEAEDPEGSGITYSLVAAADSAADLNLFEINSLHGTLKFKSARNFEKPADVGVNNTYQVVVRATVVDDPPLSTDTVPEGPHMIDPRSHGHGDQCE